MAASVPPIVTNPKSTQTDTHIPDRKNRKPVTISSYETATFAAAIGLVLLIMGLALSVYYGERFIVLMNSPEQDIDDFQSLSDVSNAMEYLWKLGDLAVVLSIVLMIHGEMNRRQQGRNATRLRRIPLLNAELLLLLALAAMMASLILWVYLREFETGFDGDLILRLFNIAGNMSQIAWILATSAVLLVANGLRSVD